MNEADDVVMLTERVEVATSGGNLTEIIKMLPCLEKLRVGFVASYNVEVSAQNLNKAFYHCDLTGLFFANVVQHLQILVASNKRRAKIDGHLAPNEWAFTKESLMLVIKGYTEDIEKHFSQLEYTVRWGMRHVDLNDGFDQVRCIRTRLEQLHLQEMIPEPLLLKPLRGRL